MEFRYARHTEDLESVVSFYTKILGLELLFSFKEHNGYDGAFLGKAGLNWHLEFTSSASLTNHTFDPEDILVFYPSTLDEYENMLKSINANGIKRVKPKNPYWMENGVMIEDPDGFGVIVSSLKAK